MSHNCPHCQKPIAIKIKVEVTTQENLIDDLMEKNGSDEE